MTIIVSAGLALVFVKSNIIATGSERSTYTAALVGALIGSGYVLFLLTVFPVQLTRGPQLLRRHWLNFLRGGISAIPIVVIGSLMNLWDRPFLTALGWALIIGLAFGIVFQMAERFIAAPIDRGKA